MELIPDDSGYDYNEGTVSDSSCQWDCVILVVVNVIICVLGLSGNGLVIWIAGFKMKKTVNTAWYLSLAISDFLYCIFLPLNTAYLATNNWIFGVSMCKFTSFVLFLNMFSSIFLLVIISIDRCISVVFPVWAQNKRTVKKASIVIILAWIISIALSSPSAIFRDTTLQGQSIKCYNNYEPPSSHLAVVFSRFAFGFVVPFLIIITCYSVIIWRVRNNQMTKSSKPLKVMSALIGAFFICWLPYHIVVLMETNEEHQQSEIFQICIKVFPVLASANSILNPLLYAFMGRDFKHKCFRFALSKIENALGEETQKKEEINCTRMTHNSGVSQDSSRLAL
ncbi:chemerin-like receptor 1 [Brienomyrus brachyistius]|uniref:chemerin-like receptor 1 n=1 Tax=Brienomyrus brachyistius TaxID=42636 RepID=UPI0020B2580B|nr:chemerin-like receptor 1 [Brienomyrus brachyistius]